MSRLHSIVSQVFVFVFVCVFVSSCREHRFTSDPAMRLTFSSDTVNFDTVFTAIGSSTQTILVYNRNANALSISRVWWKNGDKFFANIDGENLDSLWHDITIYGGDSMFLFLRTEIDPYGTNTHPIEYDTLYFLINGHEQHIAVQAYGMDVERIHPTGIYPSYHFTSVRPYLIYDTMHIDGPVTIDAGATLYMHHGASLRTSGSLSAIGTQINPIRILGDRTDYLFPKVPYRMASGQWDGVYLYDTLEQQTNRYELQHVHLMSGQVGLSSTCNRTTDLPLLVLGNAQIHNMSGLGLVVENTHAQLSNIEISNCAGYGLYMGGGTHQIEHMSVANYFGYPYTTINIHNASRWDVAAVYILSSGQDVAPDTSTILNSIITGATYPALVIDSIPTTGFAGEIAGCYLRCDSDSIRTQSWAHDNVFARTGDTVFINTYYKYGEYIYYDFRLTQQSPARCIGLPLSQLHLPVANDLCGNPRDSEHPDAGCYTYLP